MQEDEEIPTPDSTLTNEMMKDLEQVLVKDTEQVPMKDTEQVPMEDEPLVLMQIPPYTAETNVSEGIHCYLCDSKKAGWANLMDHVRRKHKIRMGPLRGTFFHYQAAMEYAAAQQDRYTKKAARPKSRVEVQKRWNAQPVIESTSANSCVQVQIESRSSQESELSYLDSRVQAKIESCPCQKSQISYSDESCVQQIPCMWRLLPLWVPRDLERLEFLPLVPNEAGVRPPITDGAADFLPWSRTKPEFVPPSMMGQQITLHAQAAKVQVQARMQTGS